jgi:hypothetical protein
MKLKVLALAMILTALGAVMAASVEAQEFNRDACYAQCRALGSGGRDGRSIYSAFSECMARCDRAFWKTYDRRMRNIEEEADRKFFND